MIRINLISRQRRRVALPRLGLLAMIGVIALAFGVGTVALVVRNEGLRGEVAALDAEIVELTPQVEEVQRLLAEIQDLRLKETIVAELEAKRLPWAAILVDVSARVPRSVWLVSLFSEHQNSLGIGGNALSYTAIAQFMRNLEASEMFEAVDLTNAARQDIAGRKVINFGLTMRLTVPQAVPTAQTTKDGTQP